MRYLTKTKTITIAVITTVSMLAPTAAYSLGIGNIKLQSKLNENLKAEIELLDSTHENVSNLYVNLAPLGKFSEANIPWNYFLKNMKLKPVKRANGTIFIELSSNTVLKEVFLNFILEVSWNKGLLYREFTVLVDPPADYNPPLVSAIPKTTQIIDRELQFSAPEFTNKRNRTQYGPTKRSDYIREIAKKTRYDDTSIEQMIIALFKANPEAFFADNANALAEKKILKIPEKETVLEISKEEALEQVQLQNTIWKDRNISKISIPNAEIDINKDNSETKTNKSVSSTPNNEKGKEKQPVDTSNSAVLTILTKLDKLEQKMELMEKNILVSKDKLTILPVSESEPSVSTKTESITSSPEGLALLAKQSELEKKIEAMQKVLTSKDALIATLQEQNRAIIALQIKPMGESIAATTELKKNNVVETESVTITADSIMQTVIKKVEENFRLLLQIGAVLIILLGLLSYFLWLQKKKKEKAEDDALNEYLKPLNLATSSFKNLDVSFNDFLTDGYLYNHDVEHKEADICTEVDIYLSYNNYKDAESLMRQAIENYPDNDEYKLKLFEVFLESNNKTDFQLFKMQLEGIVTHSYQEFWDKVAKMEAALLSKYHEENDLMIPQVEEESIDNIDTNIVASELLADNIEIAMDNEIDFDMYAFDEAKLNSITKMGVESTDNIETTVDNEIDFDMYAFDEAKLNSITKMGVESTDNIETTMDNEIDFDMYAFDEAKLNSITKRGVESTDNIQTTVDNEIEIDFDMYDFDDSEIKPIIELNKYKE